MYIFQRVSGNSLMDSAYEFNYNSQLNVNSSIPVFKPYNYTLEYYSSNDSSFNTVDHSDGNWTFDNETGIITFEDDPSIDLSNGDLYFTFVKYVGVQGLDNLLFYKNGKIGIGTQEPQSELDIHGSMGVTGDVTVKNDLKIDTNVLHINSTEKKIGINTSSPETTLDVSGSAYIDGSLNINNGIGPGFYPIGSIIMWPTDTFHNDYGTWLLCDGSGVAANDYPDLSNVLSSSSGTVYLPNFTDRYVKSADTDISYSGDISSSHILNVNNLPDHTHESSHDHDICGQLHSHSVTHNHGVDLGDHYHNISDHYHNITDNGHTHNFVNSHSHSLTERTHAHNIPIQSHSHGGHFNAHAHQYQPGTIEYTQSMRASGGSSANIISTFTESTTGDSTSNYNVALSGTSDIGTVSINTFNQISANDAVTLNINTVTDSSGDSLTVGPTLKEDVNGAPGSDCDTDICNNIQINPSLVTDVDEPILQNSITNINMNESVNDYDSANHTGQMGPSTSNLSGSSNWNSGQDPLTINIEPSYTTAFFFIRAK